MLNFILEHGCSYGIKL